MRRTLGLITGIVTTAGLLLVAPGGALGSGAGNIPGVPLPGPVVTGKLGGPIYDVVYSVVVPAAHVLQVSLSGTSGTDFDLYLFDATATDIYTDPPVGLVASSTGPTSAESITYPTVSGGLFYVDVSGATNVEGTFQLGVQVAADTTPPTVSLALDGGAPATNKPTVTATIIATDDLSGVGDVQLSTDGGSWSDWQPYQPTLTWTFLGTDGPKTLWVRARDQAGNVSTPAKATIQLITTPPLVIARDPGPGNPVTGTLPAVRVTFSEPIRVSSWYNLGLLLQDGSGTVIFGTYAWEPATNTGIFTPGAPLVPGAAYSVSLGSVVDEAGNSLVPIGSWVIRPMLQASVSMTASPRVALMATSISLSGRVVGGTRSPVVIERSVGGGSWETFVTVFPGQDGRFVTGAEVDANTAFRAEVPGTSVSAAAVSAPVRVLVRRGVTIAGASAALIRRVAAGTGVELVASVSPSAPVVPVTLSIYRYVTGAGYVLQSAVTRTTVAGRYLFFWHPGRGAYAVQLTTPPGSMYANGSSALYRWVGS